MPAARPSSVEQQVEHVELVEEADVPLDALLVQRLEDHVARPVGRVAGAPDRRLAVVARCGRRTAAGRSGPSGVRLNGKPSARARRSRRSPRAQRISRRRLVDEVVAALDRVERVPLGVVLLEVGERRADAALRRPGVGAGGVELEITAVLTLAGRFDRRPEAGAAGADDHGVVGVGVIVMSTPATSTDRT